MELWWHWSLQDQSGQEKIRPLSRTSKGRTPLCLSLVSWSPATFCFHSVVESWSSSLESPFLCSVSILHKHFPLILIFTMLDNLSTPSTTLQVHYFLIIASVNYCFCFSLGLIRNSLIKQFVQQNVLQIQWLLILSAHVAEKASVLKFKRLTSHLLFAPWGILRKERKRIQDMLTGQ